MMITLNNVSKQYGDVHAVRDVSLEIKRGEICGLLGRNGAGKTTVMKMITGYLEPTSGQVSVGGVDVLADRVGVQSRIGYMPENAPLYPEMTVQEYLLMAAQLRGIAPDKLVGAVVSAMKATGLSTYATRVIGTLSKGYKQRVGLSQAIVHKPDVLILDEPTNGLDPVQIIEIRKLIKELAKDSTVIISTHILQEIEAICDRVIILIEGQLAKDAPLSSFLQTGPISLAISADVSIDELRAALSSVPGVSGVEQAAGGAQDGFAGYQIAWSGDGAPVPQVVAAISQKGWAIANATAQPPSLERAFGDLILTHANAQRREERS